MWISNTLSSFGGSLKYFQQFYIGIYISLTFLVLLLSLVAEVFVWLRHAFMLDTLSTCLDLIVKSIWIVRLWLSDVKCYILKFPTIKKNSSQCLNVKHESETRRWDRWSLQSSANQLPQQETLPENTVLMVKAVVCHNWLSVSPLQPNEVANTLCGYKALTQEVGARLSTLVQKRLESRNETCVDSPHGILRRFKKGLRGCGWGRGRGVSKTQW